MKGNITLSQIESVGVNTSEFVTGDEREYLVNASNIINKMIESVTEKDRTDILDFIENGEFDTFSIIAYRILRHDLCCDYEELEYKES